MEILDIYNKHRQKTGKTRERSQPLSTGDYQLVVLILIFNSKGQMLIQQRHPSIIGWPGYWDITAGGAASAGDTGQQAAGRELYEEVGITADLSEATPHLTIQTVRTFCDIYLHQMDVDIESLQLCQNEVAQVKWATRDEILTMIESNTFVPYQDGLIELCFSLAKKRRMSKRDS